MVARLRDALVDPARRDYTILIVLSAYWVIWTAYGTIAKSPQGFHPDMTEIVAWSRDLSLGYLKHPPLAAWLVRGWFSIVPVAEWSYYLLAMLMPVLALWIAWRLMADYLEPEKRVIGLAVLTLVPFFNFHALKYNVNTVLMPLWAMTTLWFLRSYRTRSRGYAALAGAGAALCMLGKYWSVFLLLGFVVAALVDRRRAAYFRSPAPWITVAVGLMAISPHLWWLIDHDFAPFGYAVAIHGVKPIADAALSTLGYIGGSIGYVALPLILVLAMTRRPAALAEAAWPAGDERRLVAAAFWLPLLLPVAGAIAGRTEITSLWSMSAWTLLPVLLLSSSQVTVTATDTQRLLGLAAALPLVMLIASPAIALLTRDKVQPATAQARLLAAEVDRNWRGVTPRPLRFVGGDPSLVDGVITWSADRPRALTNMPAPPEAELKRAGMTLVCFAEDPRCKTKGALLTTETPDIRTVESTIRRSILGKPGAPQGYTIVLVPPQSIVPRP